MMLPLQMNRSVQQTTKKLTRIIPAQALNYVATCTSLYYMHCIYYTYWIVVDVHVSHVFCALCKAFTVALCTTLSHPLPSSWIQTLTTAPVGGVMPLPPCQRCRLHPTLQLAKREPYRSSPSPSPFLTRVCVIIM